MYKMRKKDVLQAIVSSSNARTESFSNDFNCIIPKFKPVSKLTKRNWEGGKNKLSNTTFVKYSKVGFVGSVSKRRIYSLRNNFSGHSLMSKTISPLRVRGQLI
eukprot:TRINITY_DN7957_c0_g3_i1.p2 TRINITY_DN7957_c0_g3~~TRINITY_DN7957_c0_g3_i1.p2  ORF type:complete len:103 (+),score=12.95 TRINITY_DN7957_c0_g3_i1:416-724(+)